MMQDVTNQKIITLAHHRNLVYYIRSKPVFIRYPLILIPFR